MIQKCSLKVNKRWFGERKYDMVSVYIKDRCGRVKEIKGRVVRKVNLGEPGVIEKSEWTSCPNPIFS